ncbi:hypothetical protein H663_015415 [Limnohabitans planktonicus II-D5]|uniref:Uncharacterized protein n=1 Tax=Limnohabitans planktonicus II-D5 TaxID=1293045 RepID=A0A2T7UAN1_9BURK|nr:hypothetical protein H663_015415 [Limnohabitans planktonicus II-D5]
MTSDSASADLLGPCIRRSVVEDPDQRPAPKQKIVGPEGADLRGPCIRRSVVEDPDMGLRQSKKSSDLKVPTYGGRAVVGRRSKTPTWACSKAENRRT